MDLNDKWAWLYERNLLYDHILGDYPHDYANRLTGENRTVFGEGVKYETEKPEMADEMPVKLLRNPRCMLHYWVTGPHILNAGRVMEQAWGFKYTTKEATWVKVMKAAEKKVSQVLKGYVGRTVIDLMTKLTRKLPGHYTASNTEDVYLGLWDNATDAEMLTEEQAWDVLLGWYGKPTMPKHRMRCQVWYSPAPNVPKELKHSRKPWHLHQLIDECYPRSRCIELFTRSPTWSDWSILGPANTWHYLGLEYDGMDLRESIPLLIERLYAHHAEGKEFVWERLQPSKQ